MKSLFSAPSAVWLFAFCFVTPISAQSIGTEFTYQGQLKETGQPVTGLYDLRFSLWDSATNGTRIGDAQVVLRVPITNGLFQVSLDFGAVFDESALWLEIAAGTNGATSLTGLLPRQRLTPVPHAGFARVANTLASPLPDGMLFGTYKKPVALQNSSNSFVGTFVGDGSSLSNIPFSAILGGADDAVGNHDARAISLTNPANNFVGSFVGDGAGLTNLYLRYINVKVAFGAKGDASTDDTAAVQAGLNYVASQDASNLTLYFPPGTYKILGTLSLPATSFDQYTLLGNNSGYRLSGAGMGVSALTWPSLNGGIGLALTNIGGYEGVIIEDLTFQGPHTATPDPNDTSIGLAIGMYGANAGWSGANNIVRNCRILGWGYGAAVTNQWGIVFENNVVSGNAIEGLRFAGSHNVSVRNCQITGSSTGACGIGVGFHPPLNMGYGDNAQLLNNLIANCTNGVFNQELNLVSINTHLESCGSYYTLLKPPPPAGPPGTTIIGGYTLDFACPLTNGFAAQILMDASSATRTIFQQVDFTGSDVFRPLFNVTNDGTGYQMPTYVGAGTLSGLWDTATNVNLYPFGRTPNLVWNFQLPLKNGADMTSGVVSTQSPAPFYVDGAMRVMKGSPGIVQFPIPHGLGFSNIVLELTVQGAPGQTNMGFSIIHYNYAIGPKGKLAYGNVGSKFIGITNGYSSKFYWTNSFGEDIYARRCTYVFKSYDNYFSPLTNDLWILSFRLFSLETQ